MTAEISNLDTKVTIPVRLDPSFGWETTQLLNRVVALWGEIPAAFLLSFNPRQHMYGYIGLSDYTMFPLLCPGAMVMIDGNLRRVVRRGWENEFQRPIYFVELRDGYRCAWCQIEGAYITLLQHPMSPVAAETFSFPHEAEVLGQVVGIAMRLLRPELASQGNAARLTAPSSPAT